MHYWICWGQNLHSKWMSHIILPYLETIHLQYKHPRPRVFIPHFWNFFWAQKMTWMLSCHIWKFSICLSLSEYVIPAFVVNVPLFLTLFLPSSQEKHKKHDKTGMFCIPWHDNGVSKHSTMGSLYYPPFIPHFSAFFRIYLELMAHACWPANGSALGLNYDVARVHRLVSMHPCYVIAVSWSAGAYRIWTALSSFCLPLLRAQFEALEVPEKCG